ncbi:uncharacterized protein LOC107479799 [Arachis duranensis]|uniref:Uncharacterized protein LOC107479799 n=1 Tax=Arachis duranensis TaxID=130453 RepID=A0A6P4CVY3_ARADU|nr:uncharacterized protein LOC107479799 [Arachis duranensis]
METPTQSLSDLATIVSNLPKMMHSFMVETRSSIRNLEIQVGQLSKRIQEIPFNTFSSNTKVSPKEEYKAFMVEAEAEPKEDPTIEELKEIRAHEEPGNVTLHAPLQREEPEEYPSSDVQEEPKEEQIARFLGILKKLKAKSSYAEALEKKPLSMEHLKSMISEKKALRGDETVVLTKECRTITFEKALCGLGSSINFMPLSVMKRPGIQNMQPAKILLEMADKSLKRAYGMVEDVLVKVEDRYLPSNFVILDTEEDRNDSIVLGRFFLATAKALIDVEK